MDKKRWDLRIHDKKTVLFIEQYFIYSTKGQTKLFWPIPNNII